MFRAYSAQHWIPVLLIAALCAGVVLLGRRVPAARPWLSSCLAAAIGFYMVSAYYNRWKDGGIGLAYSLPLHLCDVVVILLFLALLRPHPPSML
ncbi:MAG: hypothetical protein AB1758_17595, partial [Candidatus Eremiobacterota bacterium]